MNKIDNIVFESVNFIPRWFPNMMGEYVLIRIDDLNFAKKLDGEGWNIQYSLINPNTKKPDFAYLKANVPHEKYPAKIFIVTERDGIQEKTVVDSENIASINLDNVTMVDAVVVPYVQNICGCILRQAYLKIAYLTVFEPEGYYD